MTDKQNKENEAPRIVNGQLLACPDKPNCINTEYPDRTTQFIPALSYQAAKSEQVMNTAKSIILEMGGEIINEDKNYLSAIFTSSIFRFVDDFEIRQDKPALKLHIRSASRMGYSDFGVNQRRVKLFSEFFKENIK